MLLGKKNKSNNTLYCSKDMLCCGVSTEIKQKVGVCEDDNTGGLY